MIHLLPKLSLPRWLRRPLTRPQTVPAPSTADWWPSMAAERRQADPRHQADKCGNCSKPLTPDSPTLDFCSDQCRSTYSHAQAHPIPSTCPIRIAPTRPEQPHTDPPWLAAISEWDRKKAAALVESRKPPAAKEVA